MESWKKASERHGETGREDNENKKIKGQEGRKCIEKKRGREEEREGELGDVTRTLKFNLTANVLSDCKNLDGNLHC